MYDDDDAYCLDGQRLIPVSGSNGGHGTEYRLERESFTRIYSYRDVAGLNGPTSFVAQTKAGLRMEFGKTVDSRNEVYGRPWVGEWGVSKVSDSTGTNYTVNYTRDLPNGTLYVSSILYGRSDSASSGPASMSISFVYEGRNDIASGYSSGRLRRMDRRLGAVEMFEGAALVRKFKLTYQSATGAQEVVPSRLVKIEQCGPSGACLMPKVVRWNTFNSTFTSGPRDANSNVPGLGNAKGNKTNAVFGDFNADGYTDVLVQEKDDRDDDDRSTVKIFLNAGDGTFSTGPVNAQDIAQGLGDFKGDLTNIFTGDFNGDGFTDLLRQEKGSWADDAIASVYVALNNGDASFRYGPGDAQTNALGLGDLRHDKTSLAIADFDGDGLSDVFMKEGGSRADDNLGNTGIFFSNGDGSFRLGPRDGNGNVIGLRNIVAPKSETYLADFNGDGLSDILIQEQGSWEDDNLYTVQLFFGNGDGTFRMAPVTQEGWTVGLGNYKASVTNLLLGDFNGDGLTDVLKQEKGSRDDDDDNTVELLFSKGDGTFVLGPVDSKGRALGLGDLKGDKTNLQVADFNGDGLADVLKQEKDTRDDDDLATTELFLGKGDGSFILAPVDPNGSAMGLGNRKGDQVLLHVVDLNGDGTPDVLDREYGGWADDNISSTGIYFSNNRMPQLVTGVFDAVDGGTGHAFTYKPLTQARNTEYFFVPVRSGALLTFSAPIPVVTKVESASGVVGALTPTYHRYGDLVQEVGTGRGVLGFRWTESESATGVKSRTTYRHDHPFLGQVDKSTQGQGGSIENLSQTTYQYGCYDFDGTPDCQPAPGKRYFVYQTRMEEKAGDLKGAVLPGKRTDTTYDCASAPVKCFGNAKKVTITTLDTAGNPTGFAKETISDFLDDETNWFIGRLLRSQVMSRTP